MYEMQALAAAVFARLASDAAGADVRAVLGAGADGVITADRLMQTVIGQTSAPPPLPAPPFVALRQGSAPGVERIAWLPRFTWYAYGALAAGPWALNVIPRHIAAAYAGWDPAGLGIGSVEVAVQPPTVDRVLGLWVLPVTLDLSSI